MRSSGTRQWGSKTRCTIRHVALALFIASVVAVTAWGAVADVTPAEGAPTASLATGATPVMGRSRVTAAQLAAWFRSKGKTSKATVSIDVLAGQFIEEGADEGVSGDLAFAQSIVETGYFGFSTRVLPAYNNFSGLGAVDGGTGAARFSTAQLVGAGNSAVAVDLRERGPTIR
jgi:hypothetical protein